MAKKTKNDSQTKKTDATEQKKKAGVPVVKGSEDQLSEDQLEEVAGGIINGDPEEEEPLIP